MLVHSVIVLRCGKKEIAKFKDMQDLNSFLQPLYCLKVATVKINEVDTLVSMSDYLKQWVNNPELSEITFKLKVTHST